MSRKHSKVSNGISITPVSARPADPENGDVIYNSTNLQLERYENGAWISLSGQRCAKYYLSANQTINDNNNTVVVWNATSHSNFTTSILNTSTGRITFTEGPGIYEVYVSVGLPSSTTIASGNRTAIYIRKNGGNLQKIGGDTYEGAVFETKQFAGLDQVQATSTSDYIDIIVYLDFGGTSYAIGSVNENVTYLCIKKIA